MNRVGVILLNVAVALYLFAVGVIGINNKSSGLFGEKGGEIGKMVHTIFGDGKFSDAMIVILSICAIAAAVFLLLELFRIPVPITDLILMIFVIIWAVFIVIVDIIGPLQSDSPFKKDTLEYFRVLASHLVVLGTLFIATKRLGGGLA